MRWSRRRCSSQWEVVSLLLARARTADRSSSSPKAARSATSAVSASAVDHDWLGHGERFERALCSTEALLNLQNPRDPALIIYPLRRIGSRRALGHTGFTTDDIDQLGSHAAKIQDLNVGSTVGCKHMWPEWVEHPEIAHTAAPWLFFPQAKCSPPQLTTDH